LNEKALVERDQSESSDGTPIVAGVNQYRLLYIHNLYITTRQVSRFKLREKPSADVLKISKYLQDHLFYSQTCFFDFSLRRKHFDLGRFALRARFFFHEAIFKINMQYFPMKTLFFSLFFHSKKKGTQRYRWRALNETFSFIWLSRFILRSNHITLSSCFTFKLETGAELPKTGVSLYCVALVFPSSLGG